MVLAAAKRNGCAMRVVATGSLKHDKVAALAAQRQQDGSKTRLAERGQRSCAGSNLPATDSSSYHSENGVYSTLSAGDIKVVAKFRAKAGFHG